MRKNSFSKEISKAKGSDEWSFRFPVIKQLLRDDKVVQVLEV